MHITSTEWRNIMKKIITAVALALALPASAWAMGENLKELTPGYGVESSDMPLSAKSGMTPPKTSAIFNEGNDLNPEWDGPY
jgi:hypothetical protein